MRYPRTPHPHPPPPATLPRGAGRSRSAPPLDKRKTNVILRSFGTTVYCTANRPVGVYETVNLTVYDSEFRGSSDARGRQPLGPSKGPGAHLSIAAAALLGRFPVS